MGKDKVTDRWHVRFAHRQPIFEHPEIPQIDKWLAELTTIQRMVEFHDLKEILRRLQLIRKSCIQFLPLFLIGYKSPISILIEILQI